MRSIYGFTGVGILLILVSGMLVTVADPESHDETTDHLSRHMDASTGCEINGEPGLNLTGKCEPAHPYELRIMEMARADEEYTRDDILQELNLTTDQLDHLMALMVMNGYIECESTEFSLLHCNFNQSRM